MDSSTIIPIIGTYISMGLIVLLFHGMNSFKYLKTAPDYMWYIVLWGLSLPIIIIKYVILGIMAGIKHTFGK